MIVFGEVVPEAVLASSLDEALLDDGSTTQTDLAAILRQRGVQFHLEAACRVFAREKRRGALIWVERERVWRKA